MTDERATTPLVAVTALVESLAAEAEVHVVDVALMGGGAHRVLKVVVDTLDLDPSASLDVDVLARLSQRLGVALDEDDPIAGAYTLEVTSPGADRPLTTFRDFARNRGRTVKIRPADGADFEALTGTLTTVTEDAVTVQVDGRDHTVELASIAQGRVVLPW